MACKIGTDATLENQELISTDRGLLTATTATSTDEKELEMEEAGTGESTVKLGTNPARNSIQIQIPLRKREPLIRQLKTDLYLDFVAQLC